MAKGHTIAEPLVVEARFQSFEGLIGARQDLVFTLQGRSHKPAEGFHRACWQLFGQGFIFGPVVFIGHVAVDDSRKGCLMAINPVVLGCDEGAQKGLLVDVVASGGKANGTGSTTVEEIFKGVEVVLLLSVLFAFTIICFQETGGQVGELVEFSPDGLGVVFPWVESFVIVTARALPEQLEHVGFARVLQARQFKERITAILLADLLNKKRAQPPGEAREPLPAVDALVL